MDSTLRDILLTWNLDPLILAALAAPALLYGLTFRREARRAGRHPRVRWAARHAWLFYGGLAALFVALISPIDPLGGRLFAGHMLQHIILIMVAPPLLLLGLPVGPVLHAIPAATRRPLVRAMAANRFLHALASLTRPLGAFIALNAVLWFWHMPPLYDLALDYQGVHVLEHLTMLAVGLLFWWPVIEPVPVWKPTQGLWRVGYPALASIPGGILGVWLSEPGATPLYPYYATQPRLWGLSATADQQLGGALMLGFDEIIVLVACAVLFFRFLAEVERRQALEELLLAQAADQPAEDALDAEALASGGDQDRASIGRPASP